MEAEKAPFFVQKLRVKTLPTLFVFRHGQLVARLTGFEGLMEVDGAAIAATNLSWPTSRLQEWLAETGAIEYNHSSFLDDDQPPKESAASGSIRRGGMDEYDDE
jgi:hypothetical protein